MHEIIIYYAYTPVKDPAGLVARHKEIGARLGLSGRVLIAHEGINGTLEGTTESIAAYEDFLRSKDVQEEHGDFSTVWFKHSPGTGRAFPRLKVRVRNEIVTLGLPAGKDIDPSQTTGTHIPAEELKRWFESGEEFEIIDMRNDYEYAVGHFRGSVNPRLTNFRDLPERMKDIEHLKHKKVLTVCTYGVRCEKASGYLKTQGFTNVHQLHGGIGTYMKRYPGEDFLGSLYVFDERMLERFTQQYEKVGVCAHCGVSTEECRNCARAECHKQILVCADCAEEGSAWCSQSCKTARGAMPRREENL